jgi:DNA-binding NtrC family response regulator
MDELSILMCDRDSGVNDIAERLAKVTGFRVFVTDNASEAFSIFGEEDIDVLVVDVSDPVLNGNAILEKVDHLYPSTTKVAIGRDYEIGEIIESLRAGANDYLLKPFHLAQLLTVLQRNKNFLHLQSKVQAVELNFQQACTNLSEKANIDIVGVSDAMKQVVNLMTKVAQTDSTTVLITGESGTGKELVARGIHALSKRRERFFHSVNCSAIPESLFESEFFGHQKGAFTDAVESTAGWFEVSNHGTLFLDEVADLTLPMQVKFLRVLDDKVISKVGTKKTISLDLRIITATNRSLENMLDEGVFRLDLYHRLSAFKIHIPPLRERAEDIPGLVNYYVKYFGKQVGKIINRIDQKVYQRLSEHSFPGNIRELRNILERAIILCDGDVLRMNHIQIESKGHAALQDQMAGPGEFDLQKIEKKVIEQALSKCKFNKSKAAKLLKISRQALDRKLMKYQIAD